MFFDLILIGYLSYKNGTKAKLKGQNAITWGLATVAAYIFFGVVGMYFVIYNFCKGEIDINLLSSSDTKIMQTGLQQLMQSFEANPMRPITVELFGVGGYLLIRYILDKKPDKKETEVHWMDKMGSNEAD